jgi:hypothetical protein
VLCCSPRVLGGVVSASFARTCSWTKDYIRKNVPKNGSIREGEEKKDTNQWNLCSLSQNSDWSQSKWEEKKRTKPGT